MRLTFWGTRGSIAVPGPDTLRFGGNTTCLEMTFAQGRSVILDAGTGIRGLGDKVAAEAGPLGIDMLITHLHWDHINGIPFFIPVYRADAHIRVGGWPRGLEGLAGLFDSRRSDGRFPVPFEALPCKMERSDDLAPPDFRLGDAKVHTHPLNHPQGAIGLRFEEGPSTLVFVTDNELDPHAEPPEDLIQFCQGASVIIHDAQYLPEEMEQRKGWGHSDWRSCLKLARMAGAGRLVLTHHDPSRTDSQVERLVAEARQEAGPGLSVEAAYEGMVVEA